MRIGYIYPFRVHPPQGGNQLHGYQLTRGFLSRGHRVLTADDDSLPGLEAHPRTEAGADALLADIDILYVRIDANYVRGDPVVRHLLEASDVPAVWEINSPASERLAFSWLGGDRDDPRTRLGRAMDHVRRSLHAARSLPGIVAEERLRRRLARRAAAAICVSSPMGDYARSHLRIPRVEVIPNGSDPELNHPGREPYPLPPGLEGHLKVLFAGSPMYPWQGLDVLLDAARAGGRAGDAIVFLLLVNQPIDGPLPSNVITLESVPYEEVGRYICTADVCVALPPDFHWSRWRFHGSPMKLFDYMACGKPVVTSGVGQLGEIIRQHRNGLVCERDGLDLLDKLRTLATDPARRRGMGERSRRAVEELYNWDHIVEATLEVFDTALRRAPGTPA